MLQSVLFEVQSGARWPKKVRRKSARAACFTGGSLKKLNSGTGGAKVNLFLSKLCQKNDAKAIAGAQGAGGDF